VESGAFSILPGKARCRNGVIQQNNHYSRIRVTSIDVIAVFGVIWRHRCIKERTLSLKQQNEQYSRNRKGFSRKEIV
jgi:hypothetical protein